MSAATVIDATAGEGAAPRGVGGPACAAQGATGGDDGWRAELRAIARLLSYPDEGWRSELGEASRFAQGLADEGARRAIGDFVDEALAQDGTVFEQRYVEAFDFGKQTSLNLTARGRSDAAQQRSDLFAYSVYFKEAGYEPGDETPDHLPELLELASVAEAPQAALVLRGCRDDLGLLVRALDDADLGAYAALVRRVMTIGEEIGREEPR